jgi:broad specificity phosphatase PhoE
MFPITFYIARHGRSKANDDGVFGGGQLDVPLVPEGIQESHLLAKVISKLAVKPKVVIRSRMLRTQQMTDIVVKDAWNQSEEAPHVVVDEMLNERDWGDLTGKPKSGYPKGSNGRNAPPNGETQEFFYNRSNHNLFRILHEQKDNDPALVIAHKGTIDAVVNSFGFDFADEPKNGLLYEVQIYNNPRKSGELLCRVNECSLDDQGRFQKTPARIVSSDSQQIEKK